jgi:ABC-type uncharacterized transport system YnjBCD permease subunit
MPGELRDLRDEAGTVLCDYLDLVFGAGMVIAGWTVIIMMICADASWGAYLAGAILFLFCLMVGGMMTNEAWKNLRKRK